MSDVELGVTIEGKSKTISKLWKYSISFTEAATVITRNAAKMVVDIGRILAPEGPTGNLKKSIKAKYFWKLGPAATVMPRAKTAPHRHLVQYGTVERSHESGKSTGKMTSNRFMDGADKGADAYFQAAIAKEVNKHVVI